MSIDVKDQFELAEFGKRMGASFVGGEVIELVGDVGAGKTTLTKAIAQGMGIVDDVSSPSYALNQVYDSPSGVRLVHYDFYRLDTSGILADELREVLLDASNVVVIEWGAIVADVVPEDHVRIDIQPTTETGRRLNISVGGARSQKVMERYNDRTR